MSTSKGQYIIYKHNLTVLDELIKTQQRSFKQFIAYTICILIVGFSTLLTSLTISDGAVRTIIASGGTFVTSLSGFSFKEFFNKKGNIRTYGTIKLKIEMFRENEKEQNSIKSLLESIIIKNS